MRKSIRAIARAGRDSDVWPVVLLLFAVLVPAVCLLWFMNAAMRNERFAARQKLADSYRPQLASAQTRLEEYWRRDVDSQLAALARTNPPALAFAQAVEAGLADSVVLFDVKGNIAYPNKATAIPAEEADRRWAEAAQLEYRQKEFGKAAEHYAALAKESTNVNSAARALQAQVRCLVRAGETGAVVRLVLEDFGDARFRYAADAQGRLIAANIELLAYELGHDRAILQRLRQRLMDYHNSVLAAPQRRFLMKELRALAPGTEFPTLVAEELAAQVSASVGNAQADRILGTDLWSRPTPDGQAVALFREVTLARRLEPMLGDPIKLLRPGVERPDVLLSVAAPGLPGWHLAIILERAPGPPVAVYFWTAMLVLSAMSVLALLAARIMRRQAALARLKNDLAATVSHELKTPLASMRVLVDTLLASERLNEQTTRDYLELIARENDRLSRLIHNFLAFSRIERNKEVVQLRQVPVRPIVESAVKAVAGRKVDIALQSSLPEIRADPDAVGAALINLLENARKYSADDAPITVRAHANNGSVVLSVQDKGVGIPSPELKKIFKPFYQVDQSLSRKGGGCGLGLSIVQSIIKAHDGSVTVESQPGQGSTFSISLPAAKHK